MSSGDVPYRGLVFAAVVLVFLAGVMAIVTLGGEQTERHEITIGDLSENPNLPPEPAERPSSPLDVVGFVGFLVGPALVAAVPLAFRRGWPAIASRAAVGLIFTAWGVLIIFALQILYLVAGVVLLVSAVLPFMDES